MSVVWVCTKSYAHRIASHIIYRNHMDGLRSEKVIHASIVWAMAALISEELLKNKYRFVTKENLYDPDFEGIFNSSNQGKDAVQCHRNGRDHYVTTWYNQKVDEVRIYDSLALELTNTLKEEIWLLYGQGKSSTSYAFQPVQCQANIVWDALFSRSCSLMS